MSLKKRIEDMQKQLNAVTFCQCPLKWIIIDETDKDGTPLELSKEKKLVPAQCAECNRARRDAGELAPAIIVQYVDWKTLEAERAG